MISFSQILEDLYVGSYPESLEDIERLKFCCGITAVLNLQTDDDLAERRLDWSAHETSYSNLDITAKRVPMRDFDYHDQRRVLPQAVKALARLLVPGHTVYLHCSAGLGRSPLVAMAYLYWCCNTDFEEAIKYVEERRTCSPMTELLEVARHDTLQNEELRKRISLRAYKLSRQRENRSADPFRDWVDAEREILKKILC